MNRPLIQLSDYDQEVREIQAMSREHEYRDRHCWYCDRCKRWVSKYIKHDCEGDCVYSD